MDDDGTRVIRKENHGVWLYLIPVESEDDENFWTMKYSEVRILPSGWVECRDPVDMGEEDRITFYPPGRILDIAVYDEDEYLPGPWRGDQGRC